jgi:hypothetical protein
MEGLSTSPDLQGFETRTGYFAQTEIGVSTGIGVRQRFGTKWAIWRRFEQRNTQVNRARLAQALLEQ